VHPTSGTIRIGAYYLSDRLSEAHSLQLASAELGRSPLASWLSGRTEYFLWSCLTDVVRRRVASLARPISRYVAGRNKITYYLAMNLIALDYTREEIYAHDRNFGQADLPV
jgi:hypothetical protein